MLSVLEIVGGQGLEANMVTLGSHLPASYFTDNKADASCISLQSYAPMEACCLTTGK